MTLKTEKKKENSDLANFWEWFLAVVLGLAVLALVLTWLSWAIILIDNLHWSWRVIGGWYLMLSLIGTVIITIAVGSVQEDRKKRIPKK